MSQTETTFTIQGMSCGGCVNSIKHVLSAVPGIEPIHVEVGSAKVRIDPAQARLPRTPKSPSRKMARRPKKRILPPFTRPDDE